MRQSTTRIALVGSLVVIAACDQSSTAKNQRIVDACLTLVACDIGVPTSRLEGCVMVLDRLSTQQLPLSPTQIDCLRAARADCAAAHRCLGGQTACPAASKCSGSRLSLCFGGPTAYELDCALTGTSCVDDRFCGVATCPFTRNDTAFCSGNELAVCLVGVKQPGFDCAAIGSTCVAPPNESARCSGDCSAFQPRCDGNRFVYCIGGREQRRDCAADGLACFASRITSLEDPCALGAECNQLYPPRCDGQKLTFCNDGVITTVDCVERGFKSCQADQSLRGRCLP